MLSVIDIILSVMANISLGHEQIPLFSRTFLCFVFVAKYKSVDNFGIEIIVIVSYDLPGAIEVESRF